MLQKVGFSFHSVWTQGSVTQYPCLDKRKKAIYPAWRKKILTGEAGKDSFLLLEICLPGFPVLRFEVIFLVDLWPLEGLLCSFPNSNSSSCSLYEVVLSLGHKFAIFLCIPIIYWNDHLFSATEDVNENCPNSFLKIFQSKIVNAVPIHHYSVNNAAV